MSVYPSIRYINIYLNYLDYFNQDKYVPKYLESIIFTRLSLDGPFFFPLSYGTLISKRVHICIYVQLSRDFSIERYRTESARVSLPAYTASYEQTQHVQYFIKHHVRDYVTLEGKKKKRKENARRNITTWIYLNIKTSQTISR